MRARREPQRHAFTLIELLMVIVVISILATLLLTAVTSAMRAAKDAAVGADINMLAQAIASFKEKRGDYPPSRILLAENGHYPATLLTQDMVPSANGTGSTDITAAALGQRSMAYLRKFWPRMIVSTGATPVWATGSAQWYDFNGDGVMQTAPYILEGDECLTFFLGGVPLNTGAGGGAADQWSMSGWGKSPANPFSNSLNNGNTMYSGNRMPPHFEFKNERLKDLDAPATDPVRFPKYHDSLGTDAPLVYFSAYGSEGYDPNDANMPEMDDLGTGQLFRLFRVAFPVVNSSGTDGARLTFSSPPNPYTAGEPAPVATKAAPNKPLNVQWQKGQSFQILSAGRDGQYGHGGQYAGSATTKLTPNPANEVRPLLSPMPDPPPPVPRGRETDNITSFAAGTLD